MKDNLSKEVYTETLEHVKEEVNKIIDFDGSAMEIKAKIAETIVRESKVYIKATDSFPYRLVDDEIMLAYRNRRIAYVSEKLKNRLNKFAPGQESLFYTGDVDFSHTVPDWKRLFALGFGGLRDEIESFAVKNPGNEYFARALCVYKTVTAYIDKLIFECEKYEEYADLCESYRRIKENKPETLFDALAFIILFYNVQMSLDAVILRSVGGLDELLLPFYENDLNAGKTENELDGLIAKFMLQLRDFHFANNIPFYLCKTDFSEHTYCNKLSYKLLEIYSSLNVQDPKIQIRCGKDVPDDLILLAMKSIKKGNNSIVFINDSVVLPSLVGIGISESDAENYTPVGCYEPSAYNELPCTCAGRVNMPKAVLLALSDGTDGGNRFLPNPKENGSCENFYNNFIFRLNEAIESSKRITEIYESAYGEMNPSLVLSPTYRFSLECGKELYSGGAKYNNTSINVFGLATAVDALTAIRRAVFEEKILSCREFAEILKNNWDGNEKFRLKCEKLYPKYGNGSKETDLLARDISSAAAKMINGTKNGRGGVFRMGMFSIDWYTEFGKKTGATADGRRSGEIISKNMSAAIGRDKAGVTGLIRSSCAVEGKNIPNGTVLDLSVDSSAAEPEILLGVFKTFMSLGGFAIQINVLDPEVLKEAKIYPDKYSNLQVRLCGWNVYFTELSENEQDEFIKAAENL